MEQEPQAPDRYQVKFVNDPSEVGEGFILVPVSNDLERLMNERTATSADIAQAAQDSGLNRDSYLHDVSRAIDQHESSGAADVALWADLAGDTVYFVLGNPDESTEREVA